MDNKQSIIKKTSDFLIANKPSGVLSQSSANGEHGLDDKFQTALKCKVHMLTRLDRPVSGLVICALTKSFNQHYQKLQQNKKVEKDYIAIVEGKMGRPNGHDVVLKHFHVHDTKNRKARLSDELTASFQPINLSYRILKELDNYSVLLVTLTSGKFHQIRSQLAHIGHPIKGDVKYGARRGNKDRSIHLHSYKIRFKNKRGDRREFQAPVPEGDGLWNVVSDFISESD